VVALAEAPPRLRLIRWMALVDRTRCEGDRNHDDAPTAGAEHTPKLGEGTPVVANVLEDMRAEDAIEGGVCERQCLDVADHIRAGGRVDRDVLEARA
jgi:hypothetical protein